MATARSGERPGRRRVRAHPCPDRRLHRAHPDGLWRDARRDPRDHRERDRRGHRRLSSPRVRGGLPVPSAQCLSGWAFSILTPPSIGGESSSRRPPQWRCRSYSRSSHRCDQGRRRTGTRGVRADPRAHRDRRHHRPDLPGQPGQQDPQHGRRLGLVPVPYHSKRPPVPSGPAVLAFPGCAKDIGEGLTAVNRPLP